MTTIALIGASGNAGSRILKELRWSMRSNGRRIGASVLQLVIRA